MYVYQVKHKSNMYIEVCRFDFMGNNTEGVNGLTLNLMYHFFFVCVFCCCVCGRLSVSLSLSVRLSVVCPPLPYCPLVLPVCRVSSSRPVVLSIRVVVLWVPARLGSRFPSAAVSLSLGSPMLDLHACGDLYIFCIYTSGRNTESWAELCQHWVAYMLPRIYVCVCVSELFFLFSSACSYEVQHLKSFVLHPWILLCCSTADMDTGICCFRYQVHVTPTTMSKSISDSDEVTLILLCWATCRKKRLGPVYVQFLQNIRNQLAQRSCLREPAAPDLNSELTAGFASQGSWRIFSDIFSSNR